MLQRYKLVQKRYTDAAAFLLRLRWGLAADKCNATHSQCKAYLSAILIYLYIHDVKQAEKCYNDCSQNPARPRQLGGEDSGKWRCYCHSKTKGMWNPYTVEDRPTDPVVRKVVGKKRKVALPILSASRSTSKLPALRDNPQLSISGSLPEPPASGAISCAASCQGSHFLCNHCLCMLQRKKKGALCVFSRNSKYGTHRNKNSARYVYQSLLQCKLLKWNSIQHYYMPMHTNKNKYNIRRVLCIIQFWKKKEAYEN